MRYQVDPALLGGMVIRIGDRVVDSSIRTRLYGLKRELSAIQLQSWKGETKYSERETAK